MEYLAACDITKALDRHGGQQAFGYLQSANRVLEISPTVLQRLLHKLVPTKSPPLGVATVS